MRFQVVALFLLLCFDLKAQVPTPDHIVIVIDENRWYSNVVGYSSAPYINGLIADSNAALFTQSYAITHPSQPNYIHLFSGSNQGVTNDDDPKSLPFTTPNLGASLLAKGLTFSGFAEDLPSVGFTDSASGNYVRRHSPWIDWQDSPTNGIPAVLNQPFTSFPTDFSQLPTVSFVIPNLAHDMHSPQGSRAAGDTWLKNNLDAYIQWAKTHNSLFILTYDEDDQSSPNVNHIVTLFVGQMVKQVVGGGQYSEIINHHNVLRTLEDMYGLAYAGNSANVTAITDCWKTLQTISFGAMPSKKYGDAAFDLGATATSGLQVSYASSDPAIASISGATVTILKPGVVTITATQAGDATYATAIKVQQTLTINKADQTISFGTLSTKTYGDSSFDLSASATSGLTVSFVSSDPSIASISGTTVTILQAGNVTITAKQSGDVNTNAATDVPQSLLINKASQTISFSSLPDATMGDPSFALTATATSGLPVSYNSSNSKVAISGSDVTIAASGRATITAIQNGNVNFNSASSVEQTFCINPPKPVATVSNPGNPLPILNSSASSGNQWYFNGTAIANETSNTLHVTKSGNYSVKVKADDCESVLSENVSLTVTGDLTFTQNLSLFPNPSHDFIFVKGAVEGVNNSVLLDALGQQNNIHFEVEDELAKADVRSLPSGVYMLQVPGNGKIQIMRFVKF